MPAPRKYDQETQDRAGEDYQDRRRENAAESALEARRQVGELLDINAGFCSPGRSLRRFDERMCFSGSILKFGTWQRAY